MWYVSTDANVVSENICFSAKGLLTLTMSAFFAKNQHFLTKIVSVLKSIVRDLSDFLVLFSVYVRYKVTVNENVSFIDYASGIGFRIAPNWP